MYGEMEQCPGHVKGVFQWYMCREHCQVEGGGGVAVAGADTPVSRLGSRVHCPGGLC